MTILTLQRRLREAGRIRIGQRVTASNGKVRPAKLETFRFTSRDRSAIDQAAARWGGSVRPWQGAPDGPQWEVITEATELPVIVPPTEMAFDQWYEQWSGGGCHVRCDGERDLIGDTACHCDPTNRACDIHSRLSVILPIAGVGLWRLDTQGFYAGVELGGMVELVQSVNAAGARLPARLRLEQRSAKRIGPNGSPITLRYAVPVLDVELDLFGLAAGSAGAPRPAVGRGNGEGTAAGEGEVMPPLTPVPSPTPTEAEAVFMPSVSAQVAAMAEEVPEAGARRRVTPPPSTGVRPRTAMEAHAADQEAAASGPVILALRTAVNALGREGRAAFLERFGHPPQDLAPSVLPEAQAFVAHLAEARTTTGRVDGAPPDGPAPPADTLPNGAAGGAIHTTQTVTLAAPAVADIARKARQVFAAEYEAAPRGTKTKVLEHLRHALTYATTGHASLTECDTVERSRVWQRLEDVAAGRLAYDVDANGVTFTMRGHEDDGGVRVDWSQVEE